MEPRPAPGTRVKLHGLVTVADINDREGVVAGDDPEPASDRVLVRLPAAAGAPPRTLRVRPANMHIIGVTTDAASAPELRRDVLEHFSVEDFEDYLAHPEWHRTNIGVSLQHLSKSQRGALGWLALHLPPIEPAVKTVPNAGRRVFVLDLQIFMVGGKHGDTYPPVAEVLSQMRSFSRKQASDIIEFADEVLRFPRAYTTPQVFNLLKDPKMVESDTYPTALLWIATGDKLSARQQRKPVPPGFAHDFVGIQVSQLQELRADICRDRYQPANVPSREPAGKPESGMKPEFVRDCKLCTNPSCEKDHKNLKCSKCKQVMYCGKDCQVEDWKRHKPECRQRREVLERLKAATDDLHTRVLTNGMLSVAHEKAIRQRLSKIAVEGLNQMPNEKEHEFFMKQFEFFKEVLMDDGTLGELVYRIRSEKHFLWGDDAETTRQKSEAGTRKMLVTLDRKYFAEWVERYLAAKPGDGGVVLNGLKIIDESELQFRTASSGPAWETKVKELGDEEKARQDTLRSKKKLDFLQMSFKFDNAEPKDYFAFSYYDSSLGPFCDVGLLVPLRPRAEGRERAIVSETPQA
jgi:hypothetical protein